MKNIHDVIRSKEQQMQQIQKELEALKLAAKLLADESDAAPQPVRAGATSVPAQAPTMVMRPAATATKDSGTYVAASSWDASKPQFP
jgi:hypothetical protein